MDFWHLTQHVISLVFTLFLLFVIYALVKAYRKVANQRDAAEVQVADLQSRLDGIDRWMEFLAGEEVADQWPDVIGN